MRLGLVPDIGLRYFSEQIKLDAGQASIVGRAIPLEHQALRDSGVGMRPKFDPLCPPIVGIAAATDSLANDVGLVG